MHKHIRLLLCLSISILLLSSCAVPRDACCLELRKAPKPTPQIIETYGLANYPFEKQGDKTFGERRAEKAGLPARFTTQRWPSVYTVPLAEEITDSVNGYHYLLIYDKLASITDSDYVLLWAAPK